MGSFLLTTIKKYDIIIIGNYKGVLQLKFAIRYFSTSKRMKDADEIIIEYKEHSDNLMWFATEICKPEQRLVVNWVSEDWALHEFTKAANEKKDLEGEDAVLEDNEIIAIIEKEVQMFAEVAKEHKYFAVKVNTNWLYNIKEIINILNDNDVPFFFDTVFTNFRSMITALNLGVSDVYVGEELGFSITEVKRIVDEYNAEIRVYPNVAQMDRLTQMFDSENCIKSFFIRPEDTDLYSKYVDTFEFFSEVDKQDVLYDIYSDGYWMGGIDELITGFPKHINNMNLMPDFGFYRLACNQRCAIGKCKYCDISESLAAELKAKDIYIKKEKKKHEYNANENSITNEPAESI